MRKRRLTVFDRSILAKSFLVLFLLGVAGCAGTPVTQQLTEHTPSDLAQAHEITDVPFFPQTQYHCGPAALATVLNYSEVSVDPGDLADAVYTPGRQGTLQSEILTGSRRHGRLALPIGSMEKGLRSVASGTPVLIFQNLGLEIAPVWHYAVLIGYDLKAGTAVLRSDTRRRLVLDLETLEHTWRRTDFWGVVVVPPDGPVPQTSSVSDWMQGAYGLERAGLPDQALRAYETAAAHWRQSSPPLVSAANIHIVRSDWGSAENALREAVDRAPRDPIAINNLAFVLGKLGKLDEALELAKTAVSIGGGTLPQAQETLREIQALQDKSQQL